jgi:hypothetical protein
VPPGRLWRRAVGVATTAGAVNTDLSVERGAERKERHVGASIGCTGVEQGLVGPVGQVVSVLDASHFGNGLCGPAFLEPDVAQPDRSESAHDYAGIPEAAGRTAINATTNATNKMWAPTTNAVARSQRHLLNRQV